MRFMTVKPQVDSKQLSIDWLRDFSYLISRVCVCGYLYTKNVKMQYIKHNLSYVSLRENSLC